MDRCMWCGMMHAEHDTSRASGAPVPRVPCGLLVSGFKLAPTQPQKKYHLFEPHVSYVAFCAVCGFESDYALHVQPENSWEQQLRQMRFKSETTRSGYSVDVDYELLREFIADIEQQAKAEGREDEKMYQLGQRGISMAESWEEGHKEGEQATIKRVRKWIEEYGKRLPWSNANQEFGRREMLKRLEEFLDKPTKEELGITGGKSE